MWLESFPFFITFSYLKKIVVNCTNSYFNYCSKSYNPVKGDVGKGITTLFCFVIP